MNIIKTALALLGLQKQSSEPDIRPAHPTHIASVTKHEPMEPQREESSGSSSSGNYSGHGFKREKPIPTATPRPKWGNRMPRR